MLPSRLSFVDVETTGLSPKFNRIIDIGIIRVENLKIVDQFESLINPNSHIDPFILEMTGINPGELENAPSFYQIKDKIKELLADSLFVAHNVLFDYSFIKREFEYLEESFSSKYLCSVKLSKKLYPSFRHHNLDSIIERFKLECERRHRAFDDAKVIFDFYNLALKKLGENKFSQAVDLVLKRPTLPVNISEQIIDSLPSSAGVYIFYDKNNTPLYIGKSKDIRTRVLSHFSNKDNSTDIKIAQTISRIEAIETAGELGALLLEATLVKKMQPLYNRMLRYAYKLLALKKSVDENNYSCIKECFLEEVPIEEMDQVLGIFKAKKDVKNFLLSISKEYGLCPKLLGLEKTKRSCFYYHLGYCKGACVKKEKALKYNLKFDEAFYKTKIRQWPFKGPIGIKEKSQKEEVFIVDKWCVLGMLKDESNSLDDIQQDYLFDTDTYKILNRYLNSGNNLEIFSLSKF